MKEFPIVVPRFIFGDALAGSKGAHGRGVGVSGGGGTCSDGDYVGGAAGGT